MARSDLLLALVEAAQEGDRQRLRRVVETIIAEERGKDHHVLADRLAKALRSTNGSSPSVSSPARPATAPALAEIHPRRELDDLVLTKVVRDACSELLEEQQRADLLRSHGLEPRHRVLLSGPPGNGKTSLAEAIATSLYAPMYVARYDILISSFLGETAGRLRSVFDHAKEHRCVLFFDEFDTLGKERGDVHETGEIKRVVSSLLLQIDELPSYVVIIVATNHPELLDRAAWRRFQIRLAMPSPTRPQMTEWFRNLHEKTGVDFGLAPSTIAGSLRAKSFSELEDFSMDILRRLVLEPHDGARRVVADRLAQWKERYAPPPSRLDG